MEIRQVVTSASVALHIALAGEVGQFGELSLPSFNCDGECLLFSGITAKFRVRQCAFVVEQSFSRKIKVDYKCQHRQSFIILIMILC